MRAFAISLALEVVRLLVGSPPTEPETEEAILMEDDTPILLQNDNPLLLESAA
jgi:hypothetical protein